MRAQELTFPDDHFDFSFTNFVVADLDDPKIVAQHLYRTLKLGGKAIVCTFAFRPHDEAIKAAHSATRGPNAKLGLAFDPEWLKEERLKDFMVAGGFEESKIHMSTCEVFEELKDLRWWMAALWGYIGQRDNGWKVQDEEKWDEAIDILVETMQKSPGVTTTSDGGALIKFVINISISTK
jgi:SAM-dependent methyltransferase